MKFTLRLCALTMLVALFACNRYGQEKTFQNVRLFYTDNIEESEADSLGEYLIRSGFAQGESKTIQLDREKQVYQFRIVVKDTLLENEDYLTMARLFGWRLSSEVFDDRAVEMHFCDKELETQKVIPMLEMSSKKDVRTVEELNR